MMESPYDDDLLATLVRRNGAWLIMLNDTHEQMEGLTPVDTFDCASNLTVAKRTARHLLASYEPRKLRWTQTDRYTWELHGEIPDDSDDRIWT